MDENYQTSENFNQSIKNPDQLDFLAIKQNKVLIVDDDRDILYTLGSYLEIKGWEVETAMNGFEALKRLRTKVILPDIILLDYEMPLENGLCFWNEINEHPDLCFIPTIMMSGTSIPVENIPGIRAILSKPIDPSELLKLMERSLIKLDGQQQFGLSRPP